MVTYDPIRVVLDTNIVFEGLTKSGSACGLVVDLLVFLTPWSMNMGMFYHANYQGIVGIKQSWYWNNYCVEKPSSLVFTFAGANLTRPR